MAGAVETNLALNPIAGIKSTFLPNFKLYTSNCKCAMLNEIIHLIVQYAFYEKWSLIVLKT